MLRRATRFLALTSASASAKRTITIDCYYSLSSPWMYLGGDRLNAILHRHADTCRLVLKPYDFQLIAPKTGGVPLRTRPEARKSYHALELERWSEFLGVPLNLQPKHYKPNVVAAPDPNWNKFAGWMVIAAQNDGVDDSTVRALSHALLRALWAEERDIADPAVRAAIADGVGLDGGKLVELETSPETAAAYAQYTAEAEAKGVFGAPTFVVDGERFWGQDRLQFLERKIEQLSSGEQ